MLEYQLSAAKTEVRVCRARNERQQTSLSRVAAQLGNLIDQTQGQGLLDLPLWLDELTRLYGYVKPLLAADGSGLAASAADADEEYDLTRLEASDRYRQLLLLEKNTASMKKRLDQKEAENAAS